MENFPIIQQRKANDCGPTSLLMIAKFYGMTCTYEQICQDCHITLKGVSLWSLLCCAKNIGFNTLATKCSIHDIIKHITLPAILYYQKDKHYSVICRADNKAIWAADPASGMQEVPTDEFCAKWYADSSKTGILLVLTPKQQDT